MKHYIICSDGHAQSYNWKNEGNFKEDYVRAPLHRQRWAERKFNKRVRLYIKPENIKKFKWRKGKKPELKEKPKRPPKRKMIWAVVTIKYHGKPGNKDIDALISRKVREEFKYEDVKDVKWLLREALMNEFNWYNWWAMKSQIGLDEDVEFVPIEEGQKEGPKVDVEYVPY